MGIPADAANLQPGGTADTAAAPGLSLPSGPLLPPDMPQPTMPPAAQAEEAQAADACYRRFLFGDEAAFEELVCLYKNSLLLFLHSFVQDIHAAEELMIDAFAHLAASGKRFAGRSSVKTYLFAIGRNLALKHLKKQKREATHTTAALLGESTPADMAPLEDALLQTEQTRHLYAAMRALPPDYGQVLYLLYIEGMPYAEAARVLGKSTKQIDNLAQRGKAALKNKLESEGFTWP